MGENGWTIDTLKVLLESKLEAVRDSAAAAMASSEKAITKAEGAADKRFDSGNEIKQAMAEQQKTFANKSEVDMRFVSLTQRVEAMEKINAGSAGKTAGVGQVAGMLAIIIGAVAAIITVIFVIIRAA